jgi:spore germination protein YaaH
MKKLSTLLLLAAFLLPQATFAANKEISGWIPYWKVADGTKDARAHLDVLTEINPFTLSVTTEGEIKDLGGMKKSAWKKLFKEARKQDVAIIPTIMWSDTASIQRILSDKELRKEHIDNIVAFIKKGKYDGVDIDYEGKRPETRDHYSAFLTELKKKLGSKTLACTIEARTPSVDLYGSTGSIAYPANDFEVIGKVCDQVRLMTYDQQRADQTLNASEGTPYVPVADIDWVKKVAQLTAQTIPKSKIMLGVATYGREWEVEVTANGTNGYTSQWSVTHDYAMDYAEEIDIEPLRNNAGELSYTYLATSSPFRNILKSYKAPSGTPEANKAIQQALSYAKATGNSAIVNVVWWSDAGAIESKLDLAESLGLRGISIFKVDGTEDDELWDHLEN